MQKITSAVITQVFDPYAGHEIIKGTPYTPNPNDIPQGAIDTTIEYLGEHGFIACPLYAVFTSELLEMPDVQEKGITGIKLKQELNGTWNLQIQGTNGVCELFFEIDTAELLDVFARDNIILHSSSDALIVLEDTPSDNEAMPSENEQTKSDTTADVITQDTDTSLQQSAPKTDETIADTIDEEPETEEIFEDENTVFETSDVDDMPEYSGDWHDDEQNDEQDMADDLEDTQVPTDDDAPPF